MNLKPVILIISNSSVSRREIKNIIKDLDANIVEADSSREGLEAVLSRKFDIIISDILMSGMRGDVLCKILNEDVLTRHIPYILLSSSASQPEMLQGFNSGASAYISRDEAPYVLLNIIKDLIKKTALLKQKSILIVDDSKSILNLISDNLQNSGFNTLTAGNGEEALQLLASNNVDIILSDIMMPILNGFSLCSKVKQTKKWASIPFIMMSSHSERGFIKKSIQYGADSFIVKPFNIHEVVERIERLLSDEYQKLVQKQIFLSKERSLLLNSISSLVSALEARDEYTKGHSEQVANISSEMLRLTGASKEEIETQHLGGRLHDIGKIGISDAVLLKKGKLTDYEFTQIKQHPVIGAKILKPLSSLTEISKMVLYHHERIDGKGYPEGLKGSRIPLSARIIAVADTFDALTSNRPYRKGLSNEIAFDIMEKNRGTQLCPDCLDLFFSMKLNDYSSHHFGKDLIVSELKL